MRTQRPSQLFRKARMVSSGRAAATALSYAAFSVACVTRRCTPGSGSSQKVSSATRRFSSSSSTAVAVRLAAARARSSGAAVASCSVAGARPFSAARAAGDDAAAMKGATARSEATYAALLVVTMERRPTPFSEVGSRARAWERRCSAVAALKITGSRWKAEHSVCATMSSMRAAGRRKSGRTVRKR